MQNGPTDPRLVVPPLTPLHVPRPRLVSALNAALDKPLTLLSAGPGSGKTTLLSEWARQCDAWMAWLTVSPEDNDPHRFWRLLLKAVRAHGEDDELPVSAVDGETAVLLESLFAQAPATRRPLVVVIDDAHVLTHPRVLHSLETMVRGQTLHLVLAARSDPLLALHRYRLADQIVELRAADLATTRDEVIALLAAHGVTLPDASIDLLAARTEGWVAGIRLSAIRMAGTERPEDFVAEFAVDQGSIGEYLINEVLTQQAAHVRRLLIQTGFLDEVTGPLAEAVTGLDRCGETLAELARGNSFVIGVDRAQTRFRYQPLLGEVLRYLMQRQMPNLVPTLYVRAARWYQSEGDLDAALRWAARARDGPLVATLVARGGLAQAYVHQLDTFGWAGLSQLLDDMSDGVRDAHSAEVSAARCAVAAVCADAEAAAAELARVRAMRSALADAALVRTADLAALILAVKAGEAQLVEAASRRLLDGLEPGQGAGLRAAALLTLARARFFDGRHDEVEAPLAAALSAARSGGVVDVEARVLATSALVHTFAARYGLADEATAQARELLRHNSGPATPLALELTAALRGLIEADFTAMGQAVHHLVGSNAVEWDPALAVLTSLLRAQLFFGCGQVSEARDILQTPLASRRGAPAVLGAQRDMMLAQIEIALGRPHVALRLLQPYRHTAFDAPAAVPGARAYLTLGDLTRAEDCVRRVLTGETAHLGRYPLIEALLCDAEIALRRDQTGHALDMIVRAIEMSAGTIVLPFARTADVFEPLVSRHPTICARWPHAAVADLRTPIAEEVCKPCLPEPLTDRERAVLRLLPTDMSTAEIADELCVSVNTVKTHLAAIYRKLAVGRRREAVERALEIELL